jgi:uncharacterized protein YidB (DUF937 family)
MSVDWSKAAIGVLGALALGAMANRHSSTTAAPAPNAGGAAAGGGLGGLLGGLLGGGANDASTAGNPGGGTLAGGLGDLLNGLRQAGHADATDSWVGTGNNQSISSTQLGQALGPDVLAALEKQTGLSANDLLERLAQHLPSAVDQMTPHGRWPA